MWRSKEDCTRDGGTNEGVLDGAAVVVVVNAVFISIY